VYKGESEEGGMIIICTEACENAEISRRARLKTEEINFQQRNDTIVSPEDMEDNQIPHHCIGIDHEKIIIIHQSINNSPM
jgi:hypothetical protein